MEEVASPGEGEQRGPKEPKSAAGEKFSVSAVGENSETTWVPKGLLVGVRGRAHGAGVPRSTAPPSDSKSSPTAAVPEGRKGPGGGSLRTPEREGIPLITSSEKRTLGVAGSPDSMTDGPLRTEAGETTVAFAVGDVVSQASALRDHFLDLSERYGPTSPVSVADLSRVTELASQTVEFQEAFLRAYTRSREPDELSRKNDEQIASIKAEIADIHRRIDADASVQRSALDRLAGAIIRTAISTFMGAVLGGPMIALVLGDPLLSKAIEGAFGGFVGGVADEVGQITTRNVDGPAPSDGKEARASQPEPPRPVRASVDRLLRQPPS